MSCRGSATTLTVKLQSKTSAKRGGPAAKPSRVLGFCFISGLADAFVIAALLVPGVFLFSGSSRVLRDARAVQQPVTEYKAQRAGYSLSSFTIHRHCERRGFVVSLAPYVSLGLGVSRLSRPFDFGRVSRGSQNISEPLDKLSRVERRVGRTSPRLASPGPAPFLLFARPSGFSFLSSTFFQRFTLLCFFFSLRNPPLVLAANTASRNVEQTFQFFTFSL